MHKFNISSSLKDYGIIFIISSLINSCILNFLTVGINDLQFILFELCFLIFIYSFSYLFKKRNLYFLIISIILTIICIANSLYFNNYNDFTSFYLLETLFQAFLLPKEAVTNVFQLNDFIFLWQIVLMLILYKRQTSTRNISLFKKSFLVYVILLIFNLLMLNYNDIYRLTHDWNKSYVVRNMGIYNYQANDLFNVIYKFVCPKCGYENAKEEVEEFYNNKEIKPNEYTNIFKDKNVLFIHAESIQSMFINETITPNLYKLKNEGIYFNNYYSEESVGTSSDTEFTITNSLLPIGTGTVFINYDNNEYNSLIKSFKNNGYYTFSMHGNICEYWNRDKMYKKIGYDHYYCYDTYDLTEKLGLGLSDKSFFIQSADIINNLEYDKFYGTLIMLSNHTPFNTEGITFDVGDALGTRIGNYIKLVHYADEAIGEFINKVNLDNTVLVIYGDHDAKFTQKEYEEYLGKEIDFYEYEQLTKVPLIIWSKDIKHQEIDKIIGSIDVMPTIGNMFGVDTKYALGNDIFSIDDNIVVFPNGNWVTDKIYYNNQLSEYKMYESVDSNYIKEKEEYARNLIETSNNIIRYNLFK